MSRYIDAEKLIGDLIFSSKEFERVFKEIINDAPTADVEELRHGKWVDCGTLWDGDDEYQMYRCSECTFPSYRKARYCSYCGAKMDKEKEE